MGARPTNVGALGEFGLIAALTARLPQGAGVLLGPGDDAAVVAARDGRVVASTDLLLAGRHFRTDWSSAYEIGRKAAAANLADVAAMGAVPTALLVGLAAPPDLPTNWAERLVDGMAAECAAMGASVVGGDIVGSDVLLVAVTALGDLEGLEPVTRTGARPGDVVAVCGALGASAAGLALLQAGLESGRDGPDAGHEELLRAHRTPSPPYEAGPQAARLGAHALIDVSDGLLADLGHIARGSGVAIDLDSAAFVPSAALEAAAVDLDTSARTWMLTGGEDHALAACFPPEVELPSAWVRVGRVGAGEGITVDGNAFAGTAGWDHFR
ncbi:thiamine-phosphate kinase [Sporichthya sp.]|uniref:thiamine-phosphate kinase n=1 Tax=Sporichthya sp. TaxID=65475 RepID=UPI0017E0A263|nr:thiamine-phosphate kinase [Sporichthya sp.]MBA3744685.1 thiamine-phosphate kinase [Sporichthya sp.]